MRFVDYLRKQSRLFVFIFGLDLVLLVGILDLQTGPEYSFSIFYLVPVVLVTWVAGGEVGIPVAILAAVTWLAADLLDGPTYTHPAVPYWNALVRLGFFLVVAYMLSKFLRAEKRREELSEFIFHDLRAPLSNVVAGLRVLRYNYANETQASRDDLLKMCLISCSRMATLIQSLLDLRRLESGKMTLEVGDISVKLIVDASRDQVSEWASRNRVNLRTELVSDAEKVRADAVVTERVLVNLLSNAIKFSRPESTVVIRSAPSGLTAVAISVSDQGEGIPEEWADRIFEKYGQVQLSKVKGEAGFGLGLTFCRLAVEAQGGRIWLASEVNVGTTVTFTLPKSTG